MVISVVILVVGTFVVLVESVPFVNLLDIHCVFCLCLFNLGILLFIFLEML